MSKRRPKIRLRPDSVESKDSRNRPRSLDYYPTLTESDFPKALSRGLWAKSEPEAEPMPAPAAPKWMPSEPIESRSGWDVAVAYAVHAAAMEPGPARDRMEDLCMDALEGAGDALRLRPILDHPDFAALVDNPRFKQFMATQVRKGFRR